MKRRVIASLLTLVLCLTLLPAPAFAADTGGDTPEPAATDIYVSSTAGNDSNAGTTKNTAVATLEKAVEIAPDGATIYVLSDLTMTECARFYNKNLTITSGDGGSYTVTRGDGFEAQSDTARSWYNPAMIEVQGNQEGAECGLTLKNIILDDTGEYEGTVFAQAISGKSEENKDNLVYVQDAMIASNATVSCTITLGEGAVLRNFGGMSAVRVTDQAKLVMKSGSVIEDTLSGYTRSKGTDTRSVGPAGAVWLQGGSLEMENGAKIRNINGRAVYADGGSVSVGGTISGITGNPAMWQGKEGTAIHLRGENASAVLASTAVIEEISGGGSAVFVTGVGNRFLTEKGSTIRKLTQTIGVNCVSNKNTKLNGEITEVSGAIPLRLQTADVVLGEDGIIHKNELTSHGAAYVHNSSNLTIYGKINDNYSSSGKNAAALFIVPNGGDSHTTLELGGEICNNTNNGSKYGAAVELQQGSCSFTMNGGTISGNSGPCGAVQVHKDSAKFIMNGGEVTGNTSKTHGEAGIYVENGTPTVELNAGKAQSITLVKNVSSQMDMGHVYISDHFDLESGLVTMTQDAKTVTPAEDSLDIKLGNASPASVTALTTASIDKGWKSPLATFWVSRDGAASLTVGGLKPDKNLPVYVLTQKTGDDGKPASSNAPINTYAAAVDADGNVRFTLPAADVNGSGCAVAIVQPTQDFGTLTISGPETIKQNKTVADYPVAYTVTYVMSESLKNIITQAGGSAKYSLVITKDARLTGTPNSFDGNSVQVTYTLPNNAFVVGDSLFASAELTVTVGQNRYIIPSNVTETKLLGLESFHVVFDWNEGSGKTKTVSVTEGEALGDRMIADPARSGYTFTGWNTQQDGKGSSFDNSTVITSPLTVYAQWSENSSGGGGDGSKTYYYFAIEKVDAQDGSVLSSAKFGLFLDGKQIATAASNRSGIAMFRVNESDYRKINAKSDLYYQELTAPEGYVVNSDEVSIEKSNLTTSWSKAEKDAETVRNYRGSTPDLLNGDDHFAYVVGYQDGCVHPNALITRAETATIFFRLLKDDVRDDNLRTSNTFADVPNDYWANTAISTMAGLGIVQGRSSTAFDPNASITRAEFAAICARFDTGKSSGTQTFSDIKGHWAQSYIERAAELGWIKGFEDGTFRPNDCITRAQAMTMINRVLNRIPEDASDLLPDMNVWPDCNPGDWFYLAVQEATNSHNYKHKAGNYETWISMKEDPDWTRYEN